MVARNNHQEQEEVRWDGKGFPQRLEIAKGRESTNAFAQKCGISESVFRKYLAGVTVPGADKLVDIARIGGVSLIWLATGEGAASGTREAGAGESGPVDDALLATVIESVEAGLQQIGGELSPGKKAKLVVAIYRIYQSGGNTRKAPVLELVKLAL
ncbi:MAG: helix-turn-helix transcriptional regulator [Pseudomonadota bacterium]|nr:helix-turn-helix transcriptional regulator [Pseudomonadota bacterium]